MKKGFTLACILGFLLLNEDLNHFIVCHLVGGYELSEAWSKVFSHWNLKGALIVGSFRTIPFSILIVCALSTSLLSHLKGQLTLCVGYVVSVLLIFNGYWQITETLYTDARSSSTAVLGYIFIPISAAFYAIVLSFVTYLVLWLLEIMSKRSGNIN